MASLANPPAGFRPGIDYAVTGRRLSVPNAERIVFIRHSLRAGFTIEGVFSLTKIDRWFLVELKGLVDFEEESTGVKN